MSEIDLESGEISYENSTLIRKATGEKIKEEKPELYETTVRALSTGLSVRKVAQLTGLTKDTVHMIGLRTLGRDALRDKVEGRWLRVAELTSTELEDRLSDPEQMKKVSTNLLCTISGIAADKLTNLAKTRREMGPQTPVSSMTQNNTYQPSTISKEDADRIIERIEKKNEQQDYIDV